MVSVGIVGASGYTGAELLRLIAQHPDLELVCATGDSQAGGAAAELYPSLAVAYPELAFERFDGVAGPRDGVRRTAGRDPIEHRPADRSC